MSEQTWNDSDDAGYWAEQTREITEPVDPIAALHDAEDKLSRYRYHTEPTLAAMVPELEATIALLRPIVDAQLDAAEAVEDARWTREVTMTRREAWNTAVRSGRYTANGTLRVADLIAAMGFDVDTLKRHVVRHGL